MERKLKNILNGLLNSFISRNNDVNGYWGIGKLYALLIDTNCSEIKIDLLKNTILPENLEFINSIKGYNKKLKNKIEKNSLSISDVSNVNIFIKKKYNIFNENHELIPLLCSIKATYKENINLEYQLEIMCRKHSPKLESKSCRNYLGKDKLKK